MSLHERANRQAATHRTPDSHSDGAIPSDEDAQQINVVSPRQQHDHAKSQFEHEKPADDLVNTVTLAQCQEVQVVQVGGNVRDPCMGAEARAAVRETMPK